VSPVTPRDVSSASSPPAAAGAPALPPPRPARADRARAVRGLLRCWTGACPRSLVDRDVNAPLNMRAAYAAAAWGQPRPRHLAFGVHAADPWRPAWSFRLHAAPPPG